MKTKKRFLPIHVHFIVSNYRDLKKHHRIELRYSTLTFQTFIFPWSNLLTQAKKFPFNICWPHICLLFLFSTLLCMYILYFTISNPYNTNN